MPNVGEKSPPDNWLELHAASLDALVRGSAPAAPLPHYDPYPGDHPCSVCAASYAPFGVHKQWFCRRHLEEFTCLTPPRQPTQSKFSPPSVGREATSGERDHIADIPGAVDALESWAAHAGLIERIGQDEVQRLIAEAFQ